MRRLGLLSGIGKQAPSFLIRRYNVFFSELAGIERTSNHFSGVGV